MELADIVVDALPTRLVLLKIHCFVSPSGDK
jgi:hypothetical protein